MRPPVSAGTLAWTAWRAASSHPAAPHSSPPRRAAARVLVWLGEAAAPPPPPPPASVPRGSPAATQRRRELALNNTSHSPLPVPLQVVADTVIFGPLHVAGYFTHMTLSEGGSLADVGAKLRSDFWPTFSAELTVWPVVQASACRSGRAGVCRERPQLSLSMHACARLCTPAFRYGEAGSSCCRRLLAWGPFVGRTRCAALP